MMQLLQMLGNASIMPRKAAVRSSWGAAMPLTPSDLFVLRQNYPDYRRDKASTSGRLSPQMINKINVLDSKLATRAHIQPGLLNARNKNIVTQIKLQKASQSFENREKATRAIKDFLGSGKGTSQAIELKDELELLANYILAIAPQGAKWVPGPIKKIEKAMSKTVADYDYAWGENKDLVRGTLACRTNDDLRTLANLLMQTCTNEFGMFLIKSDNQKSKRDGGQMPSGYSGWNFVIQFKEHRSFGAEVQANTFDLLYGKHSKKEFLDILLFSNSEYFEVQNRLKFPGGLGHALYDIQDVARSKATAEEGNLARELCLDYNDACRGQFRFGNTLVELNRRIREFGSSLKSANAKKLWKDAVEGCGWRNYPIT